MSQDMAGPVEHPMFAVLRRLQGDLGELTDANAWTLADDDLAELLAECAVAQARLAAVTLAVVAEADGRDIGAAGATSTAGWLRGRLQLGPGEAKRTVKLAAALHDGARATGSALGRGVLSVEHARVIAHAMAVLPPVDPTTRTAAEDFLIGQATVLDPLLLRRVAEALAETLTSTPDRDEQILRDIARRELTAVPAYDGMIRLTGWYDREGWAQIAAVLDPLAAPRPATDGTPDPRSPARRRADALLAMSAAAATAAPAPAGALRPTMTVTIDLESLTGRLTQMGRLNTGELLSPAAARRVGCDADIIPILLGTAGQPLDIGRATRTVPAPIRRALTCRDTACAFPGCDRPAAWSEAHHIIGWAHGGDTALHNLVLLCPEHHTTVHHHGWTVFLEADGLPTFRPPPWVDPTGQPRRHHRYQLRQLHYDLSGPDPPD